ncbi:MAG: HNH endonuclease [Minwuia sp.]|nr:HNH endonuclease [Minwuia sp.]
MYLRPEKFPALVLNADFRPLSYFPLSVWPWQEAVKASFLERVNIIQFYDRTVSSPSLTMQLPSVIALKEYVRPAAYPAFTRFNVFLRDRFRCQYCNATEDLTFDHVIPRRAGGRTTWENVVAACAPCNIAKGGRMPDRANMHPHRPPVRPTMQDLNRIGRAFPPNYLHDGWRDYLYWDSELEP